MVKQKKEDTESYKEQSAEAIKDKGDTETITVGKQGQTPQQVDLQELVASQPDIWYKANMMQVLLEIEKVILELREDVEKIKNEVSRK